MSLPAEWLRGRVGTVPHGPVTRLDTNNKSLDNASSFVAPGRLKISSFVSLDNPVGFTQPAYPGRLEATPGFALRAPGWSRRRQPLHSWPASCPNGPRAVCRRSLVVRFVSSTDVSGRPGSSRDRLAPLTSGNGQQLTLRPSMQGAARTGGCWSSRCRTLPAVW